MNALVRTSRSRRRTTRSAAARGARFALACALLAPALALGATAKEIEARANGALKALYADVPAAKEFAEKAEGVLVFPRVVKGAFWVGGKYGEGVLRVAGRSVQYYSIASASFGFQFGGQARAEVLMFMTREALAEFRKSDGWEAGVDGSIAVISAGAGGTLDTNTARQPIVAFIHSQKGLMVDVSLKGSKISPIER